MAEIISIRVNVNDGDYKRTTGRLLEIQKHIETLNKTPVHIKIDDTGFEKATKQITAYNNSVARMVKAENELAVAKEKTAQAQAKAEAEAWKAEQQETRLATAQVNRHTQVIRQQTEIIKGENNIALQKEKTATVIARTAQEEAKANTALIQGEARLALQKEKTATATAKAEAAQRKENAAMEEGSKASSLLNNSIGELVLQYVSLRMIINSVVSSFRDALNTMKEVDSELVTIQKTTGYTGERLDQLTKSAYNLASAYGRTATEILNAASVYARAGFKDNLEDMTELSALLQNVGDLTGETAAKFLVATNAAWKMNGSYEALLSVIDGLNQQTNEAAVDMAALTSGITVAGSVFSNAGESVQTFAGLLGAGVALTQRSGSEIGRGLRTIAMNIRQIKGELDDGEIIDEASISDAAAALHSIGISVADANGELRLTSDVLTDLAAKWGTLTTAEQSYIAQSLAGKRQANILNALMNNWQEVERQMTLYANGAGSAMKENEIYLDSWEAKTKQLDAAWTKFVADLVDTDAVKTALDGIIKLVQLLDTGFGRALTVAIAVPTVLFAIIGAVAKLKAAMAALNVTMLSNPVFLAIAAGTLAIYGVVKAIDAMTTSTEEFAAEAERARNAYQEIQTQIDELKTKEEELTDVERRKLELLEKQAEIAKEQAKAATLNLYNSKYATGTIEDSPYAARYDALQRRKETAGRDEFKQIEDQMHELEAMAAEYGLQGRMSGLISEYRDLATAAYGAKSADELKQLQDAASETMKKIMDLLDELKEFENELGKELPEDGQKAIQMAENFIVTADDLIFETKRLEESQLGYIANTDAAAQMTRVFGVTLNTYKTEAEEAAEKTNEATEALSAVQEKLKTASEQATLYDAAVGGVVTALTDFGEGSYEVYAAMQDLETAIPGSTDKLYDFETATWKVDASMISSKSDLLDFIDTQKQLEFSSAISELESVAAAYWDIAGAAVAAMASQQAQAQMAGVLAFTGTGASQAHFDTAQAQIAGIKAQKAEWDAYIATLRQRSGYSGGGSGSTGTPGETTTDQELVKRQKIVELLKAELAFLKASGASTEEIVAKQREIQAALHDEADYLRSIGADETDVLALSTEWWNIQKDINKALDDAEETVEEIADDLERLKSIVSLEKQELSFLQASGASLDEINAKRKEIQASLHDQAEEMRRILATMDDTNSTEAQRKAYEEDILALSTEWWNIQKQINDDLAKAEQEKLKALEEEKKLREEIFDTLRKTVDDYYAKILSDKQEELNLEERILAVQKAQEALANAKNERTVRIFNRETGQWEWVANQKNVKSAADALKKAQDDLNKYQRDQAWKEFKSAWEYVADQIKAGAMTFKEAYAYMYAEMKKIQDTYGVDLGFVLEDSIGGFENLNYGIDELTQEVADTLGKSVGVLYEQLQEYQTAVGSLKKAFDEASNKVKNGEMKMEDAYSYLRDRAKQIADKYGIDMTGALEEAISGMDKTNMSIDELWKAVIINLMKVNSARWFDASEEERAYLHAQNEFLGALIGATYDPSGYWYLNGSQLYGSQKGGATSLGGGGSSGGGGGGVRGAAGTGKFYDSYGNEYATLEDAVRGNAAIAGQRGMGSGTRRAVANYNAYAWQDPEAWAQYSNLSEADPEYAEKLLALEAAVASGAPQEEIDALLNSLYSDTEGSFGYFGAIQGAGGTTGFVQGGYGNANGQKLLMLNGKLYDSDVKPGTMLQDLWGNRWAVGEDGHTLTKLLPAWYEDENGAKKAGYVYHATEDDNGQPVLGKQDIREGAYWQIERAVRNSDLGRAGADVMKDDTNYNYTRSGTTDVTNNSGDSYTFGDVTIGEDEAKRTTVWDFAIMAAQLGQYNG